MRRMLIVLCVMIFIIANVGLSQDIINETGKDGKFVVRDAEQKEALIIEDGNVGITGELSVEKMPEGNSSNPYVVWDPADKKFKTKERVFSKVSPLSEPLESRNWHSVGYGEVADDGISASIQGTEAAWNRFDTDYGYIQLGPANATAGHIYTDVSKFVFNKPVFSMTGEFSAMGTADLFFQTASLPRMTIKASTGNMGLGTNAPVEHLHISGTGNQRIKLESTDNQASILIDGNDADGSWQIQNPQNSSNLNFVNWSTANGNGTRMTLLSNGNVGIGTTTPITLLHVKGDAIIDDASPYLNFYTGATNKGSVGIWSNGNLNIVNKVETGNTVFATNSLERMRITNTGRIGIGTDSPEGALDVVSTTGALIVPRMTTTQRGSLPTVNGSIIYNTTDNEFNFYENSAWVTK